MNNPAYSPSISSGTEEESPAPGPHSAVPGTLAPATARLSSAIIGSQSAQAQLRIRPQITNQSQQGSSNIIGGGTLLDKNWARKLFFITADLVYPGMMNAFGNENYNNGSMATSSRVGTSVLVQLILYASFLLFLIWVGFYALSINFMVQSLKAVHGKIYCIVFATVSLTNFIRLLVGISGNKSDNTPKLAAYWLTTCLIEPPQLIFLILTNILIAQPCYSLIAVDCTMIVIVILEILVVFFRVRILVKAELLLLRRETENFKK